MEKYKLTDKYSNRNKIIAIFVGTFLTLSLLDCVSQKKDTNINEKQVEEITEFYNKDEETTQNEVEETKEESSKEPITNKENTNEEKTDNADEEIEEYVNSLKKDFNEIKSYTSEKWNSEEVQSKLATCKQKLRELLDFVFNGKEINGITFDDLSSEAKQNVAQSLLELDGWIEELFPDYKERVYAWLVRRGADGMELWDHIIDYGNDVLQEYNSRNQGANYIKRK